MLGALSSNDAGFVLSQNQVDLDWLGRDPLLNTEALADAWGFFFAPQVHHFWFVPAIKAIEFDEASSQLEFEPKIYCWFGLSINFQVAVELAGNCFVSGKVWESAENVLTSFCLDLDLIVDEVMFDKHEGQTHSQLQLQACPFDGLDQVYQKQLNASFLCFNLRVLVHLVTEVQLKLYVTFLHIEYVDHRNHNVLGQQALCFLPVWLAKLKGIGLQQLHSLRLKKKDQVIHEFELDRSLPFAFLALTLDILQLANDL